MMRVVGILAFWLLITIESSSAQTRATKQVVTCTTSDSTAFFYTNNATAFYYGEACRLNAKPLQGLNILTQKYFEDYLLQFDGNPLIRSRAEVFIYHDRLVRKHSPQQVTEEITLVDSLNVLAVKVTSEVQGVLEMIPGFPGSRLASDFEVRWEREFGVLHVGQRPAMRSAGDSKMPVTLVTTRPAASFAPYDARQSGAFSKLFASPTFFPGSLQVALRDSAVFYVIAGGDTKKLAAGLQTRN
jgi:hypothetical protein